MRGLLPASSRIMTKTVRLPWASQLGPFPFPLPDADDEREPEALREVAPQQLAQVLDRRIIEEVVERSVVVHPEHVARGLLEIGEIEDHAAPTFAFDDQLDAIGFPVRVAATV